MLLQEKVLISKIFDILDFFLIKYLVEVVKFREICCSMGRCRLIRLFFLKYVNKQYLKKKSGEGFVGKEVCNMLSKIKLNWCFEWSRVGYGVRRYVVKLFNYRIRYFEYLEGFYLVFEFCS